MGSFCDILSRKRKTLSRASFIKKAVLIQEYISESHGTDIRALVIGDRVVASEEEREEGSSEVTTT